MPKLLNIGDLLKEVKIKLIKGGNIFGTLKTDNSIGWPFNVMPLNTGSTVRFCQLFSNKQNSCCCDSLYKTAFIKI